MAEHWVTIGGNHILIQERVPAIRKLTSGVNPYGPAPAVRPTGLERARALDRKNALADQLGFPRDRIDMNWSPPRLVTMGGNVSVEAAHYDPAAGRIVLNMQAGGLNPGVLAHEVMHAKYDRVMTAYRDEREKLFGPAHPARPGSQRELTAAETTAYPTFAALRGDLEGANLGRIIDEDGISRYSKAHWQNLAASLNPTGREVDVAVDETQAEWNRISHSEPKRAARIRAVQPRSYHLYQTITKQYERLGPRGKR